MTVAAWTIRQPVVGVTQPDVADDVQRHPLGTRMNAVNAGVETRILYGRVPAALAAGAACTFDQATGNIVAGTASAVDGTLIPAAGAGMFAWMRITSEV